MTDYDSTALRGIKSHYRTGQSDLRADFFIPCLQSCSFYRRAAGYFTSSALSTWSKAIPRLVQDDKVQIYLLISPQLSLQDRTAIENSLDPEEAERLQQIVADQIVRDALRLAGEPLIVQLQLKLMAWMIANSRLILRFAFPVHIEEAGIFHEKIGIFDFPWGDQVAFTGSANETASGHSHNYETVDVYRSWLPADAERVSIKISQFQDAWSGNAQGLKVRSLSKATLKYVTELAPSERPVFGSGDVCPPENSETIPNRWVHQEIAVGKFLECKRGILAMATGTGKTRTAIKILDELDEQQKMQGAIISTDGTDLLHQWCAEIDSWATSRSMPYRVLRHYGGEHELAKFAVDPDHAVLIISREALPALLHRLDNAARQKLIIVHDEVHGMGAPNSRSQLSGQHSSFPYCLGLSATPLREYDAEGSDFILSEIGPVIYEFNLRDAIKNGILCELNYVPLEYELSDGDKDRLQQVYAKKSARQYQGDPMSDHELWIEISRVHKTAEMKPSVFFEYLRQNPEILKSTIIFVETMDYGNRLLPVLHRYTHLYRSYYSEDDRANLIDFGKGVIDCLITCHRLSQGIDIQRLNNVVLFSSARSKLETIQRIGRCLRTDPSNPSKRATIIDFVRPASEGDTFQNADQERAQWLSELSLVKRSY